MATFRSLPSVALFGQLVIRVGRNWRRVLDQVLYAEGLSQSTALPLIILLRSGGMRQGVLADELGVEGPSLVRLIDMLEGDKLVTRREDARDRRAKLIDLTEAGHEKAEHIERVVKKVRQTLLGNVDPDELDIATRVLEALDMDLSALLAKEELEA
ncbi:MarR family winged helix-turn-helix transcriptional regulator [Beijerinckia indica]|uniref:Transcriptional regulator, MarR family n=1 Tax=Beijerinckia indica subsp. indica (strain ATCC 9039 / DSM 1715 / NCIMB 8712) TaxID=395963 RepID=B2IHE7_BEII9|nr:MarR family transcriptional regulator [Beijerinckia indica]ACB95932.1 transcriptional regulator, MarR family [Beijerinckia indica subsp. indica ATCC 9039]